MTSSPKPSSPRPRYETIRELGRNRAGGRITYLAKDNQTGQQVVIKRFMFAQSGSDWSGFKAYEREIQVLRGLDHPGIPRYLDSFENRGGFCMVQEYKDAQPLSSPRSFDADDIKKIAISALEILVYLQNRLPPVMHRDIKPENMLVDDELNVYLVDFGFARIGGGEVAMSSVAAGTFGFMAPEQIYNRQLSEATDLYGLGATLICLLTGTKSTAVDSLVDEDGRINFKHLLPKLSLRFVDWLEKMVQPKSKDRYANADIAREALKPIYVNRIPEVKFNPIVLEFKTKNLGEKLTQTLTVNNFVPDTLLEGTWEVAHHESDRRYNKTSHPWISIEPVKFQNNEEDCQITVNTGRLMANQTYVRQLLLHSNASQETETITIKVDTTILERPKIPYVSLAILFAIALISTNFWIGIAAWVVGHVPIMALMFAAAFVAGFIAGCSLAAVGVNAAPIAKGGLTYITVSMLPAWLFAGIFGILVTFLVSFSSLIIGFIAGAVIKNYKDKKFSNQFAIAIALLTTEFGMTLGSGFSIGFFNLFVILSMLGSGIASVAMLVYPHWQRRKILAQYRESEQKKRLIKP